jgi:hypothetical protein
MAIEVCRLGILLKSLKEFTDDELYKVLSDNENISTYTLACICSEVLRRMIEEKRRN